MSHRKNRTIQTPGRWLLPWLLAAMLLMAGTVLFTAPWTPGSSIASAQRATKKQKVRPASQGSKIAVPKPTPTRSVFDSLGEPPPPPVPSPSPSPKADLEINPGDVISVTTTEVMLPVTVRDANGRFASELTRQDFRVF